MLSRFSVIHYRNSWDLQETRISFAIFHNHANAIEKGKYVYIYTLSSIVSGQVSNHVTAWWCSDVLYLTRLSLILFGFDQLAPGLAHVVAGLIHPVLNAVHHFTLHPHVGFVGSGRTGGRDGIGIQIAHLGRRRRSGKQFWNYIYVQRTRRTEKKHRASPRGRHTRDPQRRRVCNLFVCFFFFFYIKYTITHDSY